MAVSSLTAGTSVIPTCLGYSSEILNRSSDDTLDLQQKNLIQQLFFFKRASSILATDLKTEVRATYDLTQVDQAMKDYLNNMSGGKVVIMPK